MPDHAHLLVRLPPTITVPEFIGKLKGASSFRVNKEIQPRLKLHWQKGYGCVTIRKDEVPKVSRYIDNQEEHHRTGSFRRYSNGLTQRKRTGLKALPSPVHGAGNSLFLHPVPKDLGYEKAMCRPKKNRCVGREMPCVA
jgi:hypothetical protein